MCKNIVENISFVIYKLFKCFTIRKFPDEYKYIYERLTNSGFKFKTYKNSLMLFSNKDISFLVDPKYPWIAFEIFSDNIYNFKSKLDLSKKYTVIDIGANRGYASIYFASQKWCKNVYAYELIDNNYQLAKQNISLNDKYIKNKIYLFNYGLGNKSEKNYANYFKNRDGICSLKQNFINNYAPEEKINALKVKCKIKKSSHVLKKIINNDINNVIIKVDAEGSEYDIFEDLAENLPNIFSKTNIIIGEAHLGFQKFVDIIKQFDYNIVYFNKQRNGCFPFELFRESNL